MTVVDQEKVVQVAIEINIFRREIEATVTQETEMVNVPGIEAAVFPAGVRGIGTDLVGEDHLLPSLKSIVGIRHQAQVRQF